MANDKILPIGTNQTLPSVINNVYKNGSLNKYLPKGKPSPTDTIEQIIKAYNDWKRLSPQPMDHTEEIADAKKDKEKDKLLATIWDNLIRADGDLKGEEEHDSVIGVVNTPLAYETAVNAGVLPSREDMFPYMISIDQNCSKQDYEKLKEMGIGNVCIDMGCYFDAMHNVNPVFRQPKLDQQVKEAQDANIDFGLFTTIRSRDLDEAKHEIYEIRLNVRKYPPKNGLWLKLNLSKPVFVNNIILAYIYEELYKLGFKDQVGLYVTPNQLKTITWKNFYPYFYLWINDHILVDDIPHPVTPEFFMYRNIS